MSDTELPDQVNAPGSHAGIATSALQAQAKDCYPAEATVQLPELMVLSLVSRGSSEQELRRSDAAGELPHRERH